MNINITLDFTPGSARRLAWVSVTLLVAGAAAVAYAVPVTFVSQQKLTAAQLNQNFSDLDERVTAVSDALAGKADKQGVPIVTAWQTYLPSLTTGKGVAINNHATTGYYRRVGDTVEARIHTMFTAPPASPGPYWQWGLPDGLTIDQQKIGLVGLHSVGHGSATQGTQVVVIDAYVRGPQVVAAAGTGSTYISDTTPLVFDNGGQIALDVRVPIQGWTVGE